MAPFGPSATPVPDPFVTLQYLLPKQAITRAAGAFAGARAGPLTRWAIRRFVARYGVDMAEAASPGVDAYASFNEFFTRPLRDGARSGTSDFR